MKFKTDENLPLEVADVLKREGHDALTLAEQKMAGRGDAEVAALCRSEQRAIVTLDLDFADIRSYPPEDYAGIIVLRPPTQTIPSILELTARAIALLGSELLSRTLWIVDEHQVRIRGSAGNSSE